MRVSSSVLCILAVLQSLAAQSNRQSDRKIANCGSYIDGSSGERVCAKCNNGYAPSATREECVACIEGCKRCEGSVSNCKKCHHDYSLVGSACVKCPQGCEECLTTQFCVTCKGGYFKDNTGGCNACISNCHRCTDSQECLECDAFFDLKYEHGRSTCTFNINNVFAGLGIVAVVVLAIIGLVHFCQPTKHQSADRGRGDDWPSTRTSPSHQSGADADEIQPVVYDGDQPRYRPNPY